MWAGESLTDARCPATKYVWSFIQCCCWYDCDAIRSVMVIANHGRQRETNNNWGHSRRQLNKQKAVNDEWEIKMAKQKVDVYCNEIPSSSSGAFSPNKQKRIKWHHGNTYEQWHERQRHHHHQQQQHAWSVASLLSFLYNNSENWW